MKKTDKKNCKVLPSAAVQMQSPFLWDVSLEWCNATFHKNRELVKQLLC